YRDGRVTDQGPLLLTYIVQKRSIDDAESLETGEIRLWQRTGWRASGLDLVAFGTEEPAYYRLPARPARQPWLADHLNVVVERDGNGTNFQALIVQGRRHMSARSKR